MSVVWVADLTAALNQVTTQAMTTLERISQLSEDVEAVLTAYLKLRSEVTEEEWDRFDEHPLLSPLLDSLADLEVTAEV